jgi:hypothetical protein
MWAPFVADWVFDAVVGPHLAYPCLKVLQVD